MTSSAPLAHVGPVLLLGCGKMGGAMLEGWLKLGLSPAMVTVLDPQPPAEVVNRLSDEGICLNPDPASIAPPAVAILAVKPQTMAEALPAVAPHLRSGALVVSIMAGKTVAGIRAALPAGIAVVRAMPNTPAAIGRGITGAFATPEVTAEQRAAAHGLLAATGGVEWVDDEALIDAVTAVSGSGPAYVFHLVEALAAAAEAEGLPAELAMRLARATVAGAGELLHRSELSAATLRQNVTSPGGTTAAALAVLMAEDGLPALMRRAVAAARRRAEELAG